LYGYPHQDIINGRLHGARRPDRDDFCAVRRRHHRDEIEDATPTALTAGCNVLLNAVLDRANATPDGQHG
jgi:hypothetical protein